ncbi:MAG: 1-acyl-sn-glycerol-3-phosphate acyltransferase [Myxococcales bacterium]|nr:1-acyl-sn-glycerol-3-phosphate acyltransferase [Myxococcales bacterium]
MEPLPRYEPNAALRWLYRRFFDAIEVDERWVETVRAAAARGTVVYALRNLSLLDFLALDHLTKRYHLPEVRFANDLGLWILEPFGKGMQRLFRPHTRQDDRADLRAAVEAGASAALFLKRPPLLVTRPTTGRGQLEGDDFVRELLELQRASETPIILVPQLFLWTRRPDRRERSLVDAFIGTREWPSSLRAAGQFLSNYEDARVLAGEPLDLREVVGEEPTTSDVMVRRTIYVLLRRLERERRVVVGPVVKPVDRLIDEVVRTPRVRKVIEELAGDGRAERIFFEAKARAMLREAAASIEPDVIRAIATAMRQVFHRIYDGLEVDEEGVKRLAEAAKTGTLVLLPSHKSHVDYLFVSYVLFSAGMQVPLIAAGDNLSFFPLGSLFRRAGAFFIRRKFQDDRLYQAVLDAYVHKVVQEGFPIEFFLEGGRSRTGKLLPPKLGLLAMVVDAALERATSEATTKPIYFVPISIGYERVVETKSYVRELSGGDKEKESVAGLVKALRVLAERYGRVNMQIGEILTLDAVRADLEQDRAAAGRSSFVPRKALVARLGHQIMYEIDRATAVTGGALAALGLLSQQGRGVRREDVELRCDLLLEDLRRKGARIQRGVQGPKGEFSRKALDESLALFASAGWIEIDAGEGDDAVYVVPDERRLSLDISKNSVGHFFVPYGLIVVAVGEGGVVPMKTVRDRVQHLSRLFKYEFIFRADATFETIFEETLAELVEQGVVKAGAEGPERRTGQGRSGSDPAGLVAADPRRAALYAATVAAPIEGYQVAARTLRNLRKGAVLPKDFVKKGLALGKRMFLSGEIARREAIQRPFLENAILAFADLGIVERREQKLVLAQTFGTIEAVKAVERRIAGFSPRNPGGAGAEEPEVGP